LLTATKAEDKLVVRFGRLKLDVVFQLILEHDSGGGRYGNSIAIGPQGGVGHEKAEFHVALF
jgi:hypothetical protein